MEVGRARGDEHGRAAVSHEVDSHHGVPLFKGRNKAIPHPVTPGDAMNQNDRWALSAPKEMERALVACTRPSPRTQSGFMHRSGL
jgi:hypothetical protein